MGLNSGACASGTRLPLGIRFFYRLWPIGDFRLRAVIKTEI
jgi:hypothetical protein